MDITIIILFVITMLFTFYIIFKGIKQKDFINKSNALFFLPLLIFSTVLYSIGYKYSKGTYDLMSVFECLFEASKGFSFSIKRDYVAKLSSENVFFKASIITTTILSSYTSLSTILGFTKGSIINLFKFNARFIRNDTDFVLGCNKNSIEFAKKNKNAVLLISKVDRSFTKDVKNELYSKKIPFSKVSYNPDKLSKMFRFKKGNAHFFLFDNHPEAFKKTFAIIENVQIKEKLFLEFHVLVDEENAIFINKKLTEACAKSKSKGRVMAFSFNLYSLIGKQFAAKHNFAKYLPEGFLENGILKSDKNIQVIMFGTGKTSKAILQYSILNNQFITLNNGKFTTKPIDYILLDFDTKAFDNRIVNAFKSANPPIEFPAKISTKTINLKSVTNIQDVFAGDNKFESKEDKNTFKYYFVNVGDALLNQMISNLILEESDTKNCKIFFCVDSKKEIVGSLDDENLIPFGFKNDLLTVNNIADDEHYKEASLFNDLYNKLKGDETKFTMRNIVEKLSNLYADLNLEFKLNLLGLTKNPNKHEITKDELKCIYLKDDEKVKKYENYFNINTRNALRYQEHARWTTYYYLNGYKRMDLDEIQIIENNIIHKDFQHKKHACMTDYYKLDEVHKYEAKLLMGIDKNLSFEEALDKIETYQYDSIILDNFLDEYSSKVYKNIN